MDLRSWKKVLQEWVKECNFVDNKFKTLEESDLQKFFEVYMEQSEVTVQAKQQLLEKRKAQLEERKKQNQTDQPEEEEDPISFPSLLVDFLGSVYPDFSPHLDDDGLVVRSDYLYVYTLLMHYACVYCPTMIFHMICKNLSDVTQECVAKFFEQSVKTPKLSRELIRQALAKVAVIYRRAAAPAALNSSSIEGPSLDVSGNSLPENPDTSSNGNLLNQTTQSTDRIPETSDQSLVEDVGEEDADGVVARGRGEVRGETVVVSLPVAGSPPRPSTISVAKRRSHLSTTAPPPTPKSEMLEQQNRELLGLRAQLQTERYERGALEEQILENEHLINSLTKDNNEKKHQLAILKASVEDGGEEGMGDAHNYVPNEIEHLKRSMRKEIASKEAIITETNDRLQDLRSENCELNSQLKKSEKQLKVCMDLISDLEIRLDQTCESLNCRIEELSVLQRDKLELQQCLQEARDELHQRREVLNSSADLLDTSTNLLTSSHNVTPENLATSVIDKQLRETQQDNEQLKIHLESLVEQRTNWSNKVSKLLHQFNGSLDSEELQTDDEIQLIEEILKRFEANWRFEEQRALDMEQLCDKHYLNQNQLFEHIQQLGDKIQTLEQQLGQAQQDYNEREQQYKMEWDERECQNIKDIDELQKKLEQREVRYDTVQEKYDNLLTRYDELHASAAEADRHLCQMRERMAEKEQQFEQLGGEILELRTLDMTHGERINALVSERLSEKERYETQIEKLSALTERSQNTLEHVRCKYKECKQQLFLSSNKMSDLQNALQVNDWDEAIEKINVLIQANCDIEHGQQQLQENSKVYQQQLTDLKEQLSSATERYEEQRSCHSKFVQQVKTDLTAREQAVQRDILERQTASEEMIALLREQLQYSKAELEQFLGRIYRLLGVYNETAECENEGAAKYQHSMKEIEDLVMNLLRNKNQLQASLEDQVVQLNEITRQHAITLAGNQQWTAKVKREQDQRENLIRSLEISAEKLNIAMSEKDTEVYTSNLRSTQLQLDLNQQRSTVEQLMGKLAKAMQQLEDQDLAAIEMVANLNEAMGHNGFPSTPSSQWPHASYLQSNSESTNFMQLRYKLSQFEASCEELKSSRQLANRQYEEAARELSELVSTKAQLERQIADLQENVRDENDTANTEMSKQLKRINCSLQNLEEVNKSLNADNERLQSLLSDLEIVQSTSHVEMANLQAELAHRDKELNQFQETIQAKSDKIKNLQENCDSLQKRLEEKSKQCVQHNKEHDKQIQVVLQLHDDLEVLRKQLEKKTTLLDEVNFALDKHRVDLKQLEDKCATTESMLEAATAAETSVSQQLQESRIQMVNYEEQILMLREEIKKTEHRARMEDMENGKQIIELQHELKSAYEIYDATRHSMSVLTAKRDSLESQIKSQGQQLMNRESQLSSLELETAKEKQKAQELEQQLSVLRKEKTTLAEEKQRLQHQFSDQSEMLKEHQAQVLQVQMKLDKEKKHSELQKQELANQTEELKRAKSEIESTTKRTEKLAVKLGELQASYIKQQKELSQSKLAQDAQTEMASTLRREKESLQKELSLIKDRLTKAEQKEIAQTKQSQEAQTEAIAGLQRENEILQGELRESNNSLAKAELEAQTTISLLLQKVDHLQQSKENAEKERANVNDRVTKLEILRATHEKNLKDLNHQLIEADEEKVQLNCEIGGLNAEVQQQKTELSEVNAKLQQSLESLNDIKAQRDQRVEEQSQLISQLNELQQELDGHRLIHESVQCELEEKSRELEMERQETAERIGHYKVRMEALQQQLAEKNQELAEMASNQNDLCATYTKSSHEETNDGELALEQLQEERNKRQQLELDCQILQAKYRDAKDEVQRCEQKIKDQRLEMEGKLEKMKNKMRTLYTAEVTRMKEKQERDAAKNKGELDAINAQNAKYEEHTRKLSNQIVRLNDKILEQQKQHAILSTKLRHLQTTAATSTKVTSVNGGEFSSGGGSDDWHPFKRPNVPSANLGTNLAMEDEEGEVFNNTYLTDLKLGRVPDMMTAEELNYRNSLQPPHLRSTYAAQYDLGGSIPDDDTRDGPHSCSLDDSMSALLSTTGTSTGARKKNIGGTHYKRPGPPTPSKNGGRLSFGSSEPPREILRETCDNTGTSKTPARFKIFSSRFSLGNSSGLPRDEQQPRRKRQNLLTGLHRRKLQLRALADGMHTSTPRKSRSYYDQHRLISISDAVSEKKVDECQTPELLPNGENQGQKLVQEEGTTPHLSNSSLLRMTKGLCRRISTNRRCSVTTSSGSSGQVGIGLANGKANCQKRRKLRMGSIGGGRVSLCLHGNIFAKTGPNSKRSALSGVMASKRQQQRKKIRQQRIGCFDQARQLSPINTTYNVDNSQQMKRVSTDNNNYSLHNRNEERIMGIGDTVVVEEQGQESIETDVQSVLASGNNVAVTFNVEEESRLSETTEQLQQQFEDEHLRLCSFWLTSNANGNASDYDNVTNHDCHFEQLCRDTASTAPFHLEPIRYNEMEQERLKMVVPASPAPPPTYDVPAQFHYSEEEQPKNSPPKRRLSSMFKRK